MSLRDAHVPVERLAVLALGPAEANSRDDEAALAHAAGCGACGRELARLTTELGTLRLEAAREADVHFDETTLDLQRSRVLERLAHLGHSARVLRFPGTGLTRAHGGDVNRRWISVAAAAGLIIGILAGQIVHIIPADRTRRASETSQQASARVGSAVVNTSASMTLSDEDLLGEIDVAVQGRHPAELQALDALTPIASEIR
jgi:hypothetical protein